MMKLGKYNRLKVERLVDFGAYMTDGTSEVLLPACYIESPLSAGDEIDVFVYKDSEGRRVATTEHPYATVGEFAFLQVLDVNAMGAFLDWGLPKKNLLVPFSEQKYRLSRGMLILAYIYIDDTTQRIVGSTKIEKHLGNRYPDYKIGQKVEVLVYKHTDVGYKVIVENLFSGMIYESTLYAPLVIGEKISAYVKQVRPDGKIDLILSGGDDGRIEALMEKIRCRLKNEPSGFLPISDSSSPESIRATFQCSKKDFKKAIGHLYRQRIIRLDDGGIYLNPEI